jgi:selenium metabolism protein YedF
MKVLNCKGLACPKPVILTKKEFENKELDELEVIVDNEAASINVSKFAASIGVVSAIERKGDLFHLLLKRSVSENTTVQGSVEGEIEGCEIMNFDKKEIVILVSSEFLGNGDDKLGAALMKSYLYALTESEQLPTAMLFLNGGVKLTSEGSDVLESIKILEGKGVELLSCGTCLDFYGLKEKLAIGSVTNMYTIIEKMHQASNTIKL